MKCPLIDAYKYNESRYLVRYKGDCLKGECEWYDVTMGRCSVLSLVDVVTDMVTVLRDILKKIPTQ